MKCIPDYGSDENFVYISVIDSKEMCKLKFEPGESMQTFIRRYKLENFYGRIEEIIEFISLFREGETLVYKIDDELKKEYYLICDSEIQYMEYEDFLESCVCVPRNVFNLYRFYAEYIAPLHGIMKDAGHPVSYRS